MCPQLLYLERVFLDRSDYYRCDNIVIGYSWIHLWSFCPGNIIHQFQKNVSNSLFPMVQDIIFSLKWQVQWYVMFIKNH